MQLVSYPPPTGANAYTNTNGLDYQFQNIVYVMSVVKDNAMQDSVMELIKTTPIMLHYTEMRNYSNTIQTGTQTTVPISEFQENVRMMVDIFRPSANIGNLAVDTTQFVNPQLQQYQLQIGQIYVNAQPITTGSPVDSTKTGYEIAEQYYEFVKGEHKNKCWFKGFPASVVTTLGTAVYTDKATNNFVLMNDLEIYPPDAAGMDVDFFSGINTKQNPQPLQLIMKFTIGNPTIQMDSFTLYDSHCVVQQGEVYILS